MARREDLHTIAIIGAGPIIIGQACEFDYSGTQAVKALKEEGYRVVLVNSNPATIMTDPGLADATYVEPITAEVVARILARERPDAVLPTMGGQTGLNTALALSEDGTLDRLGIELIGANKAAIAKAEDRQQFHDAMEAIGLPSPASRLVGSYDEAMAALDYVGLPAIIRPSYTLGGTGGGIVYNRRDYQQMVEAGLDASPVRQVLIEESVLGWKEFEMEVVRDRADNCIIICGIENLDPMGIHTGDSITVAPTLTLTDKEYQLMRNAAFAVLRTIGVETGGSNVQFAVHPETGRMVVIEMNPRVSRSSALASKATGFPIARVAAKLAVGYTLDELTNDITGVTPASFEPTIDYVVTKIPRFTFEKFQGAQPYLTTAMKSVGEAMAIGRSFQESLQKALRSMETGLSGLDPQPISGVGEGEADKEGRQVIRARLAQPTPDRLLIVAQAMRQGVSLAEIYQATHIDMWFLRQVRELVAIEGQVAASGLPAERQGWAWLKGKGFSDARLAALAGLSEAEIAQRRRAAGAVPVFKCVDTCAGEFAAQTAYMYSCYELPGRLGPDDEAVPSERAKVVVLGGGPNRIGQGIEFDYCCVHACFALEAAGYETIMINCNPETVSTDYDTAQRLFFEPLTREDVIEVIDRERSRGHLAGAIVQYGGQTPLKLARALEARGIPILGTSPDAIDLAEDRWRFQDLLHRLDLRQPANAVAYSKDQAVAEAERIGYPLVLRPSYVLGGRAMEIVHDRAGLEGYIDSAVTVSGDNPVLLDSYLVGATEVDVDAIADGTDVYVAGIMEHIEEAGIHSGDSACALPPYSLSAAMVERLRAQTRALARGLAVVGLMNVQFAVQGESVYVLEVNPRASRTVPFVAKAVGVPIAKIAARVMAGEKLADFALTKGEMGHVAVKEAVFPFDRFPGVDILLGPEMKSTGEVMGLNGDLHRAFGKAQLAAGVRLPRGGGCIFLSVRDQDKPAMVPLVQQLVQDGYRIVATDGTYRYLAGAGLPAERINKVLEGSPHIVDAMIDGDIQLVINTVEGKQAIKDSFSLRRTALEYRIPYYTTVAGAQAVTDALGALTKGELAVRSLQDYGNRAY